MSELDLTRRHDAGTLLGTTFKVYGRHWLLFTLVTALVIVPYTVGVDGLWLGYLQEGGDAEPPVGDIIAGSILSLPVTAMITAMHVVIVMALGRGETPTVGQAMTGAGRRLGVVLAAILMATLATGAGLILLIVPGIWLFVRFYFGAQAAVVDDVGPVQALTNSADTVKGQWWEAFGLLLLGLIIFGAVGGILEMASGFVGSGAAWLALVLPARVIGYSLGALWGTLLFFHLRAQKGGHTSGAGEWIPPTPPDAPERPAGL